MRTEVPTKRFQTSGEARPRIPNAQEGHFRSRLLLAPSSQFQMSTCTAAKIETRFLGAQADTEPAA
jgi:hypothetical protein